jgi:hypothetical protein
MGKKSTDKVLIDWRLGSIWWHDIQHNYTQHNDTLQTDTQHYSSVIVLYVVPPNVARHDTQQTDTQHYSSVVVLSLIYAERHLC